MMNLIQSESQSTASVRRFNCQYPSRLARLRISVAIMVGFIVLAEFTSAQEPTELPLLAQEDFEKGLGDWKATDVTAWKLLTTPKGQIVHQFKQSEFKPPHRSPRNILLWKPHQVSDFVLTARVHSTTKEYPHRDVCLFFGYQDPAHYYYVHFGKRADDHANQIFIVNDVARKKISERSTEGTPWTEKWHTIRVVRRVNDGLIEVYFDDLKVPTMVAHDKRFIHGRVGIGSFDDTAEWDDVELRGIRYRETSSGRQRKKLKKQ